MGEELAKVAFADPPYNVKIAGFVSQSARLAHREFAMAVGEMTEDEFIAFLRSAIACARRFSVPGAVQFWCQDWRHELCLNLGDGVDQAAEIVSRSISIPSLNFAPLMIFGNWF
jgi:hypothetical protein